MKMGNLEVYGIIYKITNSKNGKVYIGQTTEKQGFNGRYHVGGKEGSIERVYRYHKWNKEHNRSYNKHLLRSIEKYGFEAFEVIEIFDIAFSKTELDIKEKVYIQLYDSYFNGYNDTFGGGGRYGYSPSQETRDKISKAQKGKIVSDETRQRMSEANKGEKNSMYGKTHTKEARAKMSEKGKGRVFTEDHKRKIGESIKGKRKGVTLSEDHKRKISSNNPNKKAVYCYELDEIRLTTKDWAEELGINPSMITNVLKGRNTQTHNYHFRYATEKEIEEYKSKFKKAS